MYAPNLSTSPYMSRVPPEKPRQLAKTMRGRFSALLKSAMAWAVLKAESGYQTCPACARTASRDAGLAGSAGMRCSTRRVSTAMTPIGMPPSLARPTTTDLPQSARYSVNEPWSKKPESKVPSGAATPASMWRGSYGVAGGRKPMSRSTGSTDAVSATCSLAVLGTYESQRRIFSTPSWSSEASWCATPLGSMICGPPSWSCDTYTSLPRSLLSAEKPVRMMGPLDIWITRCASRLMYAPMPTERPVTKESVNVSS
mmetsp:Transcript_56351/g.154847  ORF Transcript_56351/g.154847 Transcript_56351/m.154847 type:complete len:256 (-) Transcript_56351:163-930(-)